MFDIIGNGEKHDFSYPIKHLEERLSFLQTIKSSVLTSSNVGYGWDKYLYKIDEKIEQYTIAIEVLKSLMKVTG